MTNEEMKAALDQANLALVAKIGKQPYIPLCLSLRDSGKWSLHAYIDNMMSHRIDSDATETPAEAFASVMAIIAAMPDEATRNLREFQAKLAEVIDLGNKHGIAVQWMNPIVATARALAENAITKAPQ